jgi:hypothetical protein
MWIALLRFALGIPDLHFGSIGGNAKTEYVITFRFNSLIKDLKVVTILVSKKKAVLNLMG